MIKLSKFIAEMFVQIARRVRPPRLAVSPYVFNRETDTVLASLGRTARCHLASRAIGGRPKVLFFLGYHHSKFVALNDATLILALQLRGADVVPVVSGMFYKEQDVIYGGAYNKNRCRSQFDYSYNENTLVSSLLSTDLVSLTAFLDSNVEASARDIADCLTFSNRKSVKYKGFAVSEMAARQVGNMNNVAEMLDTEEHVEQLRWHTYNIIRLIEASRNLIKSIRPTVIVSNIPFYDRWRVPFEIAGEMKIPFYSYMLGEKKNALAWNLNSNKFFDSSGCWESFKRSRMHGGWEKVVDQGREDRACGRISHISYLSRKSGESECLLRLRALVDGRRAVLFPVNVLVDAAALFPTPSFASCIEMVSGVIDFFRQHPPYVCILKAHPGEKIWAASGTAVGSMHLKYALRDLGISLPDNVFFIDYSEDISSFSLYEIVDGLIAFSSTCCIEMSWFGKSVISVHDAHYCVSGIAYVPKSRLDFFDALEKLLNSDLEEIAAGEIKANGRKYYFLYNYICQIDFGLVEGNDIGSIPPKLLYSSIDALTPGANAALDYICDSILSGKPIFDENRWPPVTG